MFYQANKGLLKSISEDKEPQNPFLALPLVLLLSLSYHLNFYVAIRIIFINAIAYFKLKVEIVTFMLDIFE